MGKSERELLFEISGKLDRLIGLFATKGKTEDRQIEVLRGIGFDWKFIGAVTGLQPDTVRMRLGKRNKS